MNDNKINEDNLRKLIYLRERELGINSELQLVESNLVMAIEKIISIAPSFAEGVDLTTASIMDNLNMILYNLDRAISVENNSEIKTNLNTQRGILADKIDEYAAFKKRVDDRKEIIEKARNLPKGTITAKISNLNNKKEELARTKNKLKGLISQGDMESLKGTIDYLKGKVERLTSEIEAEKDILEIYKSESSLGEALRKNKEAAMAFIEKYSNDLNQNIDNDIELFNNEIMEFAKEHDIPLLSMGIIEGKFREVEDKKDMLAILDNKKLTAGDIKALISLGMGNEKALAITKQLEKHKENALAIGYLKQKLLGTGNNPEIVEKITELEKKQQLFENRDEEKKKSSDNHLDVEFREIDPKEDQKDSDKDQEKESQKDDVKNASPEGNETKPGNDEAPEKEGPKQIGEGKPDNPEGHDDGDDETIPGDETPEEGKNGPEKDPTPPLLPPHVIKLTDEQKEAYEEIVRQGIGKFSNTEFTEEEVADFVNNHPLISKFAGPDEAQIKENIKNDILKYCKKFEPEIPEDDEEEKKDWKALLGSVAIFTGGFATGLALSCVPGIGTIRMAMATAKLGVSAVNFVSEKLGHGKIINISQKIEQLKNSKFAKKHPKIAAGVDKAYEVLTSKEFNLFVNGVSAGYITGNVIEMVTGKTVLENIKSAVKPNETPGPDAFSGADGDNGALAENTNGTTPDPKPPVTPTETPEIPIDLTPVQGQTYDLSEIAKGYVASGNKDAVNLITSAGKDAVFDRAVTAGDGQIWYHFKQANGLGYAWFPKDVVEEVIEKSISR